MIRPAPIHAIAILMLLLAAATASAQVRLSAGAGVLYPDDATALRTAVEQYLAEVEPIALPGPVVGCVVPHSSLKMCGPVIAGAVKPLQRGQYDRVILLSPALLSEFRGCSIPAVQYFRTPLGDIELDGPAIHRITLNSMIDTRSVIYRNSAYTDPEINRTPLHEREFAGDVVLPFLQVQLGTFKLLPIVVGDLERNLHRVTGESKFNLDEEAVKDIAQSIYAVMDDRTLVVVVSEFTRYGAANNFTPFNRNVLRGIAELDMEAFKLVNERRYKAFEEYLAETGSPITGQVPILIGMRILPRAARGLLMGYQVSAKITGDPSTSVSYGGISFVDGSRPIPAPAVEIPAAAPAQDDPAEPEESEAVDTDVGPQ
ncbi:MAG: hypothetical protein AMXMBFR82_43420 [Candidatus Hydrogenedentota bacterium]